MSAAEKEIKASIQACNAAWTTGNPRDTARAFHADAVMVSAAGEPIARGRDKIVDSFVDYCASVRTLSFDESDWSVHVVGRTAVASYAFRIRYEVDGNAFDEVGREVLAFALEGDRWSAVWRMQLPSPKA